MLKSKLFVVALVLFAVPLGAMEKDKDKETNEKIGIIRSYDWPEVVMAIQDFQKINNDKSHKVIKRFGHYNLIKNVADVISYCNAHKIPTMSFLQYSKNVDLPTVDPSRPTLSAWKIMWNAYQLLVPGTGTVLQGQMRDYFDKVHSEYAGLDKFWELIDQTSVADIKSAKKEAARQDDVQSRRVLGSLYRIEENKKIREKHKEALVIAQVMEDAAKQAKEKEAAKAARIAEKRRLQRERRDERNQEKLKVEKIRLRHVERGLRQAQATLAYFDKYNEIRKSRGKDYAPEHMYAFAKAEVTRAQGRLDRAQKNVSVTSDFFDVVRANDLETGKRMLAQEKFDPKAYNDDGITPIHIAVFHNNCDFVELLLRHGASLNAYTRENNGNSPVNLMNTANERMVRIIRGHQTREFHKACPQFRTH